MGPSHVFFYGMGRVTILPRFDTWDKEYSKTSQLGYRDDGGMVVSQYLRQQPILASHETRYRTWNHDRGKCFLFFLEFNLWQNIKFSWITFGGVCHVPLSWDASSTKLSVQRVSKHFYMNWNIVYINMKTLKKLKSSFSKPTKYVMENPPCFRKKINTCISKCHVLHTVVFTWMHC